MLHCCIAGDQWRPVVGLEVHRNLDRSTVVAYHLGGLFCRFRVVGQEVTSIVGRTVGAAYAILVSVFFFWSCTKRDTDLMKVETLRRIKMAIPASQHMLRAAWHV